MNAIAKHYVLILISGCLLLNCQSKDEPIQLPKVTSMEVSEVKEQSAVFEGVALSDGGASILAKGVCWSESANPTIEDNKTNEGIGIGNFSCLITGLKGATIYHVRAYATTSAGTGYGEEMTFTTLAPTITDNEGNTYKTVSIGTQVWMSENLKATKFTDGTPIPYVTDHTEWWGLTTPGYCWYDNNEAIYKEKYGALYNYYAVIDNRNICPSGWHVPTVQEWNTLINYLGGNAIAGGKLKETGTSNWMSPNTNATNSSGFSALPGGKRYWELFLNGGYTANFWSTTVYDHEFAHAKTMLYNNGEVNIIDRLAKPAGLCVRCIKD